MRKQESIWQSTTQRNAFAALTSDATTDVVVVGGGITGLTAAIQLERAGKK